MTMQPLKVTFTGINPLLQNNPQMADPLNEFKKACAVITKKGVRRTDEDYAELGRIELKAKIYFDNEHGIFVPSRWVLASLCKISNAIIKVPKASIRAGVFMNEERAKLYYRGMDKVVTEDDVILNPLFDNKMILPQGQVRVAKHVPIFHDWSFTFTLEFDDSTLDFTDMKRLLEHAGCYGGFGDFRPTFGRATAEVTAL